MTTRKQVEATDAQVGRRAREIRESLGMPQVHVSIAMKAKFAIPWHVTTPSKVEAGERSLRLAEAVALASILGVTVAELVGEPTESSMLAARELRDLRDYVDARLKELG